MNKYEEVINSCSRLIYSIIRKNFKGYDIEDLYQVGALGVIKAYDNYKKDKGASFSTYAYKYIYGEIYMYVNNSKIVKTPREVQILYRQINEAKNILEQMYLREATLYEISSFLEIEPQDIINTYNSISKVDSLDRVIYEDGKNISLYDTVKDIKDYYNIDYMFLNEEINKLPSPDKEIVYLSYFEDRTQSEIADILGLNQVGVSRNLKRSLRKIRDNFQNVA